MASYQTNTRMMLSRSTSVLITFTPHLRIIILIQATSSRSGGRYARDTSRGGDGPFPATVPGDVITDLQVRHRRLPMEQLIQLHKILARKHAKVDPHAQIIERPSLAHTHPHCHNSVLVRLVPMTYGMKHSGVTQQPLGTKIGRTQSNSIMVS